MLEMELWRDAETSHNEGVEAQNWAVGVYRPMVADSLQFYGEIKKSRIRICIKSENRIRIRIKVKSRIRICIKGMRIRNLVDRGSFILVIPLDKEK